MHGGARGNAVNLVGKKIAAVSVKLYTYVAPRENFRNYNFRESVFVLFPTIVYGLVHPFPPLLPREHTRHRPLAAMLPPKHRGDMRQRATLPQPALDKPGSSSRTTLPQVPPSSRSRLNTPYQASKALSLEPLSTTHMSPARNAQLPNYDTPLFLPSRGFGTQPIEPLRVTPRWPAPQREPAPARLIPRGSFLRTATPQWYRLPPYVARGADEFERDHRSLVGTACDAYRRCYTPSAQTSEINNEAAYQRAMLELRWNRFVADPKPPPPPQPAALRKPKKRAEKAAPPFDIDETFWKVRRDCDSEGLYDSDACHDAMVHRDWEHAMADGRLERLITRTEAKSGGDDDDDDGREVDDIERVLCEHAPLIYALYDEYSLYGGTDADDIFSVPGKGYSLMVDDLKLDVASSKTCRLADLDTLFIEVNAASARQAKLLQKEAAADGVVTREEQDAMRRLSDTGLSRPEFLAVLVGVAIKRYVDAGALTDVSEALNELLSAVIAPRVAVHVSEPKQEARRLACYAEPVVRALISKLQTLRAAFLHYSPKGRREGATAGDARKEAALLNPSEFIALCRALLPGDCYSYLSERDLQRIFLKARMRVIDPIGGKRRLRVHNLNFEDFVEAFVRVALVVPNPGPRDLTEIGVRSALEWYEVMTSPATDADLWSDFCEAHCHGTEAFDVAAVVRERDPKGTELAARLTLLCDWLAKRMKELGIAGGGAGGSRKSKRGS